MADQEPQDEAEAIGLLRTAMLLVGEDWIDVKGASKRLWLPREADGDRVYVEATWRDAVRALLAKYRGTP